MTTLGAELETVLFIAVGDGVFALWILMATLHSTFKRLAYEKSRREIAAYVAEGSMTPKDGERLLKVESAGIKDACAGKRAYAD